MDIESKQHDWKTLVFKNTVPFSQRCKIVYKWQCNNNPVYNRFINAFGLTSTSAGSPLEIPLLPIRAFKEASVITDTRNAKLQFQSSGTGNMQKSRHWVPEPEIYRQAIKNEFYKHFNHDAVSILAYTPSYSDNSNSSLIWMLNELIGNDPSVLSRFLPIGKPLYKNSISDILEAGRTPILFGAAFGLLDLIEYGSDNLPNGSHIIETGGMKTHRREMGKKELRNRLSEGFSVPENQVHSEYGMCELLSQMYAIGGEEFRTPHWVQVTLRNPENPFEICKPGIEGKIGIIDLANFYSCAFILTDDKGVMNEDGSFRVLGRWNDTDPRGCNFLIDSK